MRLNQSRYKLECECGYRKTVTAGDIGEHGLLTWRWECPKCKTLHYHYMRSDTTRLHEATLDLQFEILDVFADIAPPLTVRQVYYQLTTRKAVDKTEAGYNKVQRELTKMRRAGTIPYGWLADNSRTFYEAETHRSLQEAAADMARWYRRDLWAAQNVHVEIWLEKRALVGQLNPICNEFGVRLYPCGGYSSISYAFEAATQLREIDKPIYIYHLSDFDADGAYSSVALERELRRHGAAIEFERLALTRHEIDRWGLHDALRPQKRKSARYKWWAEQYGADQMACELDAIHPADLRQLVHNAIQAHIDPAAWERLQRVEAVERESIAQWAAALAHSEAEAATCEPRSEN